VADADKKRELLRGPLLKIERAKQHVNDLNRQVNEYLSRNPFELRIRERKIPPQRLIYIKADAPIPDSFSLVIGDAAHNLRSALDHLCFAMVSNQAEEKSRARIGFPFAKRGGEGLSGAIATRQMHLAPKHVIDELHALNPYASGDKYLFAVSALNERDKHHFILTVGLGIQFSVTALVYLLGNGGEELIDPRLGRGAWLESVGDWVRNLDPGDVEREFDEASQYQPPFTVGFSQDEFLANEHVIDALKKMTVATENAVRRLAAAYFR
jgi:hypothetical protein